MTKNIRISLYILIPILLWMTSGLFVKDTKTNEAPKKDLFTVGTILSEALLYQPTIKLKATSRSEARVDVKAKTSGEVVNIGSTQGKFVSKDSVLCSLGVVELNRTEVKAPFSGFIEQIVKPGNYLERGQVCATIIQLNPIIFVAEVPEFSINKVEAGQDVDISLVTGEFIKGKLTFVSKSASPSTRTFKVESQIENKEGMVRDGVTAEMIIKTKVVMAHKISPSILLLSDSGKLGIRSVDGDIVKFNNVTILEDSESGLWITGIPKNLELIVQGQGFVEDNQKVLINKL